MRKDVLGIEIAKKHFGLLVLLRVLVKCTCVARVNIKFKYFGMSQSFILFFNIYDILINCNTFLLIIKNDISFKI